jgi:aspartokinase
MENETVKLAVLEQKFADFVNIVNKIDDAIGKLSEVNINVGRMLAVHEERIEQAMKTNDILINMIQDVKNDNNISHQKTEDKINDIESELSDEIALLQSKYDEVSKIKWMTVGCGILLAVLSTAFSTLASGWWTPSEMQQAREGHMHSVQENRTPNN